MKERKMNESNIEKKNLPRERTKLQIQSTSERERERKKGSEGIKKLSTPEEVKLEIIEK